MKRKLLLTLAILLLAGLLSACAGADTFGSSSWPGVVASEDTVYLAYGTQVYAINLQSGAELWHYPAKASNSVNFYAPPVLTEDGQLLVAGYDSNLYSLDPNNKGAENWIFENAGSRYVASPLAAGDMIFAASADGFLYALDMDGKLQWSFETEQPIWANPVTDPACECIYVASMDHHVYAIKTSNGAQIWRSEDLGGAIVGTPAYADGTLYVGTFGKEVIALDASSGSVLWRFTAKNWVWASPAISGDLLLAGDLDGYLYAINPESGLERWSILQDGPIASTPLITADRIYFTTETETIYAADLQGNIVWKQTVDGKLYGSPLAAGEVILVAPIKGDYLLVAFNSEGAQKWSFAPAK